MELKTTFRNVAGMTILLVFFAFTFYLASKASLAAAEQWNRLYSLFSSIEALGFAAAGMFLGRVIETPQVTQLRKLETQNAGLTAQSRQSEAMLKTLEEEIESARTAISELPAEAETIQAAQKSLEQALMRIGTTRVKSKEIPDQGERKSF